MSNAAEGTRTLVIEKFLAHPPEKVWRALTESQLLAQWLMNNDFRPSVGDKFQFRSQPVPNWSGIIDCEVLIVEPLRRLSYTWGTLGIDTAVLWILTPAEGGTLLRMEHSGFAPDQNANYTGANYGWTKFLGNLECVLGGGEL
ncbi:MAG TPA: SRPBCC domain-containing protein [Terracidiphilus sp.]